MLYGLGTENQNLPGFVAMCPGGYPIKGAENWQSGFLPGIYQGTFVDSQHRELPRLIENIRSPHATTAMQRRQLDLLGRLNAQHQQTHQDSRLDARIKSFELAFRMQSEAEDAFDISREPQYIQDMYGSSVHGRQTLIARRLLERGVRYVQLWHGAGSLGQSRPDRTEPSQVSRRDRWPNRSPDERFEAARHVRRHVDHWGGEFGRTPTVELNAEGKSQLGRDHNHYGFSVWLAGGGVRGGTVYGATDDFGFKATENIASVHDLHATILHLMGFDHERLTYRYAARDFRLTDVYGKVIQDVIA